MTDVLVAGVEVGSSSLCIATVNKHGLQIVLNKESGRETPCVVSFRSNRRYCGTEASGHASTNLKNTVFEVVPIKTAAGMTCPAVQVTYQNQPLLQRPEQLLAALLNDAKQLAEQGAASPIQLLVLACPVHFTDAQRQGVIAAAHTAGMQVGALVNTTSAAALTYSRFHESELTTKPILLGIIDVGHSNTQVCIARLKRGSVEVLAHAWDADLGATHFIDILFDICASDFQRRHGLDVHTNPKAAYRLRHECAKALRVLSANKDAHVLAECLMQDHDLATSITRQQLEAAAAPLLQRLLVPMRDAAQRAGLTGPDQLDTVELTGGGGRIPAVSDMVQGALGGREPARSLNSKEAAAEGCAWTAALLCGRFKVVLPELKECAHRTVMATWQGAKGSAVVAPIINAGTPLPADAALVLAPTMPTTVVHLSYADQQCRQAPPSTQGAPVAGSLAISPPDPPANQRHSVLRVLWEMNSWGMLTVPAAVVGAPGVGQLEVKALGVHEGVHALPHANLREGGVAAAHSLVLGGPSQEEQAAFAQQEAHFQHDTRQAEAAAEARNALEALVYRVRDWVGEGSAFAQARGAEAATIKTVLDNVEDWLYGEGEHESAERYAAEASKLQKVLEHAQAAINNKNQKK